jgi:hypothetical protein
VPTRHTTSSAQANEFKDIIEKVKTIKSICGEICDTDINGSENENPEAGFQQIRKTF